MSRAGIARLGSLGGQCPPYGGGTIVMSILAQVVEAAEKHNRFVEEQVRLARADAETAKELLARWQAIRAGIATTTTPTGLKLPRLALPEIDEAGQIARYLYGEGLPGEFPFVSAAYREMYLDPLPGSDGKKANGKAEEPTRLFAGFGLAEDTNARFHYLTRHQRSARLSTAFDGPTLYGVDSNAQGVLGKVGEGGVAIDTVEDMQRFYDGFNLGSDNVSVSMTINGPAPTILAMFIAAAKHRFGDKVVPNLRGTIQADVLKEVQRKTKCIFPLECVPRDSDRHGAICDDRGLPRWYPISISGYHIAEACSPCPCSRRPIRSPTGYLCELFRRGAGWT